nr:helix-turn-helix transcriptional regulator [Ectobacillus ponti]
MGQRIKERRKELGLTMTEVANETNLSQSAISMIENGLRQPTLQTITRLSQVLQYDFAQLLTMNQTTPVYTEEKADQGANDVLQIEALQFQLPLQLLSIPQPLPDEELNRLVVSALLQEAQKIFQEEQVQKRLEQAVAHVLQADIERKQRELEQTIRIFKGIRTER